MIPFGKTCLIRCEIDKDIINEGGIFILNNSNAIEDTFWKGYIEEYGTLVTEEERKNLPKIGEKIIMSYGKTTSDQGGIKLVLSKIPYYIRSIDEILGVFEDE